MPLDGRSRRSPEAYGRSKPRRSERAWRRPWPPGSQSRISVRPNRRSETADASERSPRRLQVRFGESFRRLCRADFAARVPPTSNTRLLLRRLEEDEDVLGLREACKLRGLDGLRSTVAPFIRRGTRRGQRFDQTPALFGLVSALLPIESELVGQFLRELAELEDTVEFGEAGRLAREALRVRRTRRLVSRAD